MVLRRTYFAAVDRPVSNQGGGGQQQPHVVSQAVVLRAIRGHEDGPNRAYASHDGAFRVGNILKIAGTRSVRDVIDDLLKPFQATQLSDRYQRAKDICRGLMWSWDTHWEELWNGLDDIHSSLRSHLHQVLICFARM